MILMIYGKCNHYTHVCYNDLTKVKYDCNIKKYLSKLCLSNGGTLQGHLLASQRLMPDTRKLPIYLPEYNDYYFPLYSPTLKYGFWISGKNFLKATVVDGEVNIIFKNGYKIDVDVSLYIIRQQYKKYLTLKQKHQELKYRESIR